MSAENNEVVRAVQGKSIVIGDSRVPIVHEPDDVLYVDILTEHRHAVGTIYLSLGNLVVDGNNPPEANVVARLRFSLVMAQNLRDILANLVEDALKPADKSQAN